MFHLIEESGILCSNYIPSRPPALEQAFAVKSPAQDLKPETFPGYLAPIVRRSKRVGDDTGQNKECVPAMFGMVPPWANVKLARSTYNARSETVAIKPSFRHAWKNGQFCIVPAEAIFEPCYESGSVVRWSIGHVDGQQLGIAGIWEQGATGPDGQRPLSLSMLTINADDHPLMRRFHRPADEKRMLVFLAPHEYDNWLQANAEEARSFLTPFPAEQLIGQPAPVRRSPRTKASTTSVEHPDLF